jgi:MoxR-like ATPase
MAVPATFKHTGKRWVAFGFQIAIFSLFTINMAQLTADEAVQARANARKVIAQVEKVLVGKHDSIETVLVALLARGHALLEDIPGVGKTTLAKALARAIGGTFKRIQFTPDLLPGDVTGLTIYHQKNSEFSFVPGPIFANIVLADEINRATPKTQSALLEAMEESQVTVEGTTRSLPQPFFVLATQNPIEYRGTFPLPEAQMDRFLLRVGMGYPTESEEGEMLARHAEAEQYQHAHAHRKGVEHVDNGAIHTEDNPQMSLLERVEVALTLDEAFNLQNARSRVFISPASRDYIVALTHATRNHPQIALGASPRGSILLQRAAQSAALLAGREFVTPDDVKSQARAVLSHRLILRGDTGLGNQGAADSVVRELLDEVPVP